MYVYMSSMRCGKCTHQGRRQGEQASERASEWSQKESKRLKLAHKSICGSCARALRSTTREGLIWRAQRAGHSCDRNNTSRALRTTYTTALSFTPFQRSLTGSISRSLPFPRILRTWYQSWLSGAHTHTHATSTPNAQPLLLLVDRKARRKEKTVHRRT